MKAVFVACDRQLRWWWDVSVFTAEYHITHVYYTINICLSIYNVHFHGKCRSILMFLMDYYVCIRVLLIHAFNGPIMVIQLVITLYSGKLLTVYNWNLLINYQLLYCFQYTWIILLIHEWRIITYFANIWTKVLQNNIGYYITTWNTVVQILRNKLILLSHN